MVCWPQSRHSASIFGLMALRQFLIASRACRWPGSSPQKIGLEGFNDVGEADHFTPPQPIEIWSIRWLMRSLALSLVWSVRWV